jgi:tRNA (cytosine49-C5)-methyltransferase
MTDSTDNTPSTLKPPPEIPPTVPTQLLTLLKELYPNHFTQICSAWTTPKALTVRHNPLRDPDNQALTELTKLGLTITPMTWYQDAWLVSAPNLAVSELIAKLEGSKAHQLGQVYRQNLASMIPPLLLDLPDNAQVLDIAASPGSKTSQIAAILNNSGAIVANDISQPRLYKLRGNLERLGVTNVTTRHGLGEKIWQQFPAIFDSALVDVPCSMEGRIRFDKPATYENWSIKQNKSLAKRQQWLLMSAVSTTKPGGCIVYSTCTLSPIENECVIDWVLSHSKRPIQIEPINIRNFPTTLENGEQVIVPGLTTWQNKTFAPELGKTWRIVPNSLMEGFYVAKLRVLT